MRRTAVAVRHKREVGIHARIPTTIAKNTFTRLKITNIKALAGRTYKRTRATTKTSFAHFFPSGIFEKLVEIFGLETA